MRVGSLDAFIAALPKAELHLHLEGSVDEALARKLAIRRGTPLPRYPPPGEGFGNFGRFLGCYMAICNCFEEPEDFHDAVVSLAERLRAQGVRYAEVTFTTMSHETRGVGRERIAEGLVSGRAAAAKLGVTMRWVYDVVRSLPEQAEPTLRSALAMAALDPGSVVGFGVGGPERETDDPRVLADVFTAARQAGLHSLPHAGEQAGPKSIWGALEVLGAERLGHGVRCLEDPELVRHLAATGVPLEVCPTSNVHTGVVATFAEHPLPALLAAGLQVSIGSDDPPLFGTDLCREYQRCVAGFGWDAERVRGLARTSIEHSFMEPTDKQALLAEIAAVPSPSVR